MQNSKKTEGTLEQLRRASLELAHGCGLMLEMRTTTREEIALLEAALCEMHGTAKNLLVSTEIDPALDHDGDTQPNNDKPEP